MTLIDLLLPHASRLLVVLAVVVVSGLTIGLGRVVAGSARPAVDLFVGWGVLYLCFVVAGTLTPLSFRVIAGALLVPALAGLALLWRDRRVDAAGWRRAARILVLAVPLVLIVAGMRASQWDELAHWLPNGFYLAVHDRFPSAALPNPASGWPAYPYALPLISYLAGLLLGGFSEAAGIVFNLLLLVACAWAIGDLIADHRAAASGGPRVSRLAEWGAAAGALLVAIPLNPSFVTKIALTNYCDSATACALAVAALIAARWDDGVVGENRSDDRLALACGCVLSVLIGLRQANLVLFVLFASGVGAALLLEGKLLDRRAVRGLLALPMPLIATWLWQRYASVEMPAGAFRVMPLSQWHVNQLAEIAGSMWSVAVNKGGHFGLMAVLVALAVATLRRPTLHDSRARALCRMAAVQFLGYTAFLLFAYLALFTDYEAGTAASFWRYSTQLGMLGVVAAVAAVLPVWRLRPGWTRAMSALALVLVVLAPPLLVKKIRFDVDHPHDGYLLAVGRALVAALPPGAHVDLLDPRNSFSDLVLVRYQVLLAGRRGAAAGPDPTVTIRLESARQAVTHPDLAPYVWLLEGGPEMRDAFALELPAGASYLLRRDGDGFRLVKTWPDTPQTETFAAADFD